MERMAFTRVQYIAIRDAVIEWIRVARKEGYEPIASWTNAEAEVWHSALLYRLLSGDEPLEPKPPLRFSYPDYSEKA